jgi:hypothetical protein
MARLSDEFSSCVDLDFCNGEEAAAGLLPNFDVLIFVNSTRFISRSIVAGRPVILVETLAWLRDAPPPCSSLVSAFFAQRFFDHAFSPALNSMANFCAVGPIVPKSIADAAAPCAPPPTQSPIVHCGGLFSPMMAEEASEEFVAQTLGAVASFGGQVRAILPPHLHKVHQPTVDGRISLIDCSSASVHQHISGSEFALTTTGIEFTYESMLLGVPTLFLPPFNASQNFQVEHHARCWGDSVPFDIAPMMPSAFGTIHEATNKLQRVGMSGGWKEQFAGVSSFLSRLVPEQREAFLARVRGRQQRAIGSMGANGAKAVASRILHEVGLELAPQ